MATTLSHGSPTCGSSQDARRKLDFSLKCYYYYHYHYCLTDMSPSNKSSLITLHILTIFLLFQGSHSLEPLLDSRCLDCIRNVSSALGTDVSKRCEGYYCGQFQISYTYWAEAGKPSTNRTAGNYEKCARDRSCAEQTVKAYFNKFKRDCNNDGVIDCLDMAALHRSGPTSCSSGWFYKSRFWLAFNRTSCATEPARDLKSSDKSSPDSTSTQVQRTMKNQTLSTECLDCICEAVTGCNANPSKCGNGGVCGPFALSQTYWKEGKRPGASWTSCARTKECSIVTVKNYMEKYKRDCNDDGFITCEDYAAIHRRGHRACNNKDLYRDPYWMKFSTCRANQKPENDVNMVKVNEGSSDDLSSGLNVEATSQLPRTSYEPQYFSAPPPRQSINKPTENFSLDSRGRPELLSKPHNSMYPVEPVRDSEQEPSMQQTQPVQQDSPSSTTTTTTSAPTMASVMESVVPMPAKESPYQNSEPSQNQSPPDYVSTSSHVGPSKPRPQPQLPTVNLVSPHLDQPDQQNAFPSMGSQPAERPMGPFDKTVMDIVRQPDFSKSYPPAPPVESVDPEKSVEETDVPMPPRITQFLPPAQNPVNQIQSVAIEPPVKVASEQKAQNPVAPEVPSIQLVSANQPPLLPPIQLEKNPEEAMPALDSESLINIYEKSINETGRIAADCLECICDASSNCDTTVQCISKQREKNRCGLYMISYNQFVESDISLLSLKPLQTRTRDESEDEKMYRECTTDKICAERLIHLYIEKYQRDCNNDGKIDCYDIAAIHRVGPENCNSDKFLGSQYWRDFNICYTTDRLATTVQA